MDELVSLMVITFVENKLISFDVLRDRKMGWEVTGVKKGKAGESVLCFIDNGRFGNGSEPNKFARRYFKAQMVTHVRRETHMRPGRTYMQIYRRSYWDLYKYN